MTLAQWLPFAIASAILVAIPGPTVLLVVSYALGHGRKYAFATTVGVALGDLTAMTASMLGLGVVLAASAELFMAVKWIGAAYLFYLGAKLWRAPVVDTDAVKPAGELRTSRIMAHAYAVTTLNPKSIIFSSPSCRSSWIRTRRPSRRSPFWKPRSWASRRRTRSLMRCSHPERAARSARLRCSAP